MSVGVKCRNSKLRTVEGWNKQIFEEDHLPKVHAKIINARDRWEMKKRSILVEQLFTRGNTEKSQWQSISKVDWTSFDFGVFSAFSIVGK